MPPHITNAKEVKQVIDDKANIVEMDDEADEDRRIESAFSIKAEPDDSFYGDGNGDGVQISTGANSARFIPTGSSRALPRCPAPPLHASSKSCSPRPLPPMALPTPDTPHDQHHFQRRLARVRQALAVVGWMLCQERAKRLPAP
ncbi:hypothetical protein PR003_g16106 [Phytophthora rubi]|uniref:Uncharacterized protein n=1 Tax=Phytophthora rubi TaxID=129364 RepID=A0A6A4F0C7_9STRA|nr:hypothetical protein PR003_g16106 [Phytophthora rubi]